MGISTNGRIKGKVTVEQIKKYLLSIGCTDIKTSISENEVSGSYIKVIYGAEKSFINKSGFITFTTKEGNSRCLCYIYDTYNYFENESYWKEYEEDYPYIMETVYSETTYISLGRDEEAIELISNIISTFGGGWIDKNDCDDIPYEIVEPTTDYKPVYSEVTKVVAPVIKAENDEDIQTWFENLVKNNGINQTMRVYIDSIKSVLPNAKKDDKVISSLNSISLLTELMNEKLQEQTKKKG